MQMHRIVDIKESQDKLNGININCESCGENYDVQVKKEGYEFTDFEIICCLFCGQQIKFY